MDIHTAFRAQYHATLTMLKQAVEKCPPELWNDPQDRNKFWHMERLGSRAGIDVNWISRA
ncbi:MAG: hypothetical protein ACOYYS_11560 [Chloroflexota bacterium]